MALSTKSFPTVISTHTLCSHCLAMHVAFEISKQCKVSENYPKIYET